MSRSNVKNPIPVYLLFILLFLTCTAALLSLCRALCGKTSTPSGLQQLSEETTIVYVIDAGHGGEDGGAVGHLGNTEIQEKDINLAIAKALASLLQESGAQVILTRESDTLLYDRNVNYQ